ncbi:hypothetical protein [Algoriphagus persicinus]|uniref:hypothetical protein n=1 Tax=Algoriphagus persicinus TaxID=3108754 RepID=UPI002B40680B|nr:hypothetical protein [Algoriphagus sp. E1-3-M2]
MKTTNTFGIRFFLKNNSTDDLEIPLYVRITVDGTRVDISLKRKICLRLEPCIRIGQRKQGII